VGHLEERVTRLEVAVAELAEAQRRSEERLSRLEAGCGGRVGRSAAANGGTGGTIGGRNGGDGALSGSSRSDY
jgi:hypothetical protein